MSGRPWRFKYRVRGVEKLLTLGAYPDLSLKRAREKRDDARRVLAEGIDPGAKRRAESDAKTNTFQAIADEWLLTKRNSLIESTWHATDEIISPAVKMGSSRILQIARHGTRPRRSPSAEVVLLMTSADHIAQSISESMKS